MESYFDIHKFYKRKAIIDSVFNDMYLLWLLLLVSILVAYQMADRLGLTNFFDIVFSAFFLVGTVWTLSYFVAFISTFKYK